MAEIDNFSEPQERYGGNFIAEQDGRVVAFAPTHGEVREYVRRMGLGERRGITYCFIQPNRRAG